MRIALGADHRGHNAALALKPTLEGVGHQVELFGDCTGDSCDYPNSAWLVGSAVASGDADRGILVCGSGIGMSIAANKVRGVRAALVTDELAAQRSRAHNDANVICLPGDLLADHSIDRIINVWLATDFEGGRHARRVDKIMQIDRGEAPTSADTAATA